MPLTPRRLRSLMWLSMLVATAFAPGVALAQGCLSGTLADEFTADRMGLARDWIIQLPSLAPGRTLEHVSLGDGLVVAETSDGTVHAIQAPARGAVPAFGAAFAGSLLWSRNVGRPGGQLEPAGIGPDLVVVSQDKDVYGLERSTGMTRWKETEKNMAATGAAAIGSWVYSPNGAGMTRFAARPLQQPGVTREPTPAAAATPDATAAPTKKTKGKKKRVESLLPSDIETGGAVAYPPTPFTEGVLWCTTDGLLVTLQPTEVEWRRLEFALENPPAGAPTVRDRSIFAATTNGDLARIDLPVKMTKRSQLELAWHVVLDGPAESGAFLAGDAVVVSLGELGIAAYSAESGERLWQTCFPGTILSAGGGRVWLIDRVGRLSALDLADGLRRETLCLGPFKVPLVNQHDDRLLLASPSGMLVSLSPRTVAPVTEPAPVAEPAARPTATEDDAATEPRAEDMPEEPMPAEEMAEPDANQ